MLADHNATLNLIRTRLAPLSESGEYTVAIEDDSHRHAGHAGAREGGYFTLTVVSDGFRGMSTLQRHREILALLGDLRAAGIHALSIEARERERSEPVKANSL